MVRTIAWIGILGAAPVAVAEPAVDAGLVVGFPTALPTGLSRGVGASASFTDGPARLGLRAAWVTATESTMTWEVTHSDLQLRLLAGVEHVAGRGTFGLRFGGGGTLVHESRLRVQGARAGLTGEDLQTSAWAMVPAADLHAVVALGLGGPWHLSLAGGPSIALVDSEIAWSWNAQLGIGWSL